MLSLHHTPMLVLTWRIERRPTDSQSACSLPSSIVSMVAEPGYDPGWRPYESRVLARGTALQ